MIYFEMRTVTEMLFIKKNRQSGVICKDREQLEWCYL